MFFCHRGKYLTIILYYKTNKAPESPAFVGEHAHLFFLTNTMCPSRGPGKTNLATPPFIIVTLPMLPLTLKLDTFSHC